MFLKFHLKKDFVLFLIIFPILTCLETILFKNADIFNNFLLIDSIPLLFFIIIYGIEKYISSSNIQKKKKLKLFQSKKKEDYKNVKICLNMICILILNLITFYLSYKVYDDQYKFCQYIPLIFFFLNDKLIFKNAIYSHHILSMIMILIVNLSIVFLLFKIINNIFFFIYNILYGYCFSLCLLLVKNINTKYDINTFLIGFFFGVTQIIYSIKEMNNFIEIVKNNFLSFFIMAFTYFLYDYLHFYILTKYTPIHSKICAYFSIIVYWFYEASYNIPAILIIIFSIISSMIYLEIIELDFCEFNKDIKLKISNRGDIETQYSISLGDLSSDSEI